MTSQNHVTAHHVFLYDAVRLCKLVKIMFAAETSWSNKSRKVLCENDRSLAVLYYCSYYYCRYYYYYYYHTSLLLLCWMHPLVFICYCCTFNKDCNSLHINIWLTCLLMWRIVTVAFLRRVPIFSLTYLITLLTMHCTVFWPLNWVVPISHL